MKLKVLLLSLLLSGCALQNSSTSSLNITSNITSSIVSIDSSNNISTKEEVISSTSSSNQESSSSNSSSDSSSSKASSESSKESSSISSASSSEYKNESSSEFNACLDKPGGKNEDGSDKLPIPCNKNNKVVIGNDNASMTSFSFYNSLPDNFRAIYGNNIHNSKNIFYSETAGGGYEVKMGGPNDPCRGIQTAMFETNLKLEIRVNIGGIFNNSKGNDVDKDLPVMVIYGFDEDGNYLRKVEIEKITKDNENGTIRKYMDGSDVAYLELRSIQCAYKSSQGYNYALLGLDLIAWPYSM